MDFGADYVHVGHKIQEANNHDLRTLIHKSNVTSETTVQQRIKLVLNAPSVVTLPKYFDLQTFITWVTEMMNNKRS